MDKVIDIFEEYVFPIVGTIIWIFYRLFWRPLTRVVMDVLSGTYSRFVRWLSLAVFILIFTASISFVLRYLQFP